MRFGEGKFDRVEQVVIKCCVDPLRPPLNFRHNVAAPRTSKWDNDGLTRFWSGHAEMGKILFPVRGAEIWKRRELDATSRPFSRPTWLDTAG